MLLCIHAIVQEIVRWEAMLDALDAVSPLVEDSRAGLAFLDMHGIAGNPQAWIAQAHNALAPFECAVRIAAGPNKIAAQASAYVADGTVCEPGTERALLAPLPLTLLDIEPEIVERLRLLGIERLRDLARLPHGPFVRRFGSAAASWHELARGMDRRPFVPRPQTVAIEASIFGEGRASDEAQVFFALRMLLTRIGSDLERCGKRAGALQLSVELENADACDFDVPLAPPTAHELTMFEMLRAKLEGATFASPIVGLSLRAIQLEEGGEEQTLLCADDLDPRRVAVTIARLEAALGAGVARARTREAYRLEERFTYESFTPPSVTLSEGPCRPEPRPQGTRRSAKGGLVPQLRLLEVREIPVGVRNGEPATVDRHVVRQCTGPWRIAERPQEPNAITRDEYDVVLENGTFARIYHQGAHWYLRGIYE